MRFKLFTILSLLSFNVFALVDINTAPSSELQTLTNIDAVCADDIIIYRYSSPFVFISDIINVTCVTTEMYLLISPLITVSNICFGSSPDTLTISPITNLTFDSDGYIIFDTCLYDVVSQVALDSTLYNETDCKTVHLTKTNIFSDSLSTDLDEFLCTNFITPDPDLPEPTTVDNLYNVDLSIPDWGVPTDINYSGSYNGYTYNVTFPVCYGSTTYQDLDQLFLYILKTKSESSYFSTPDAYQNWTLSITNFDRYNYQVNYSGDVWLYNSDTSEYEWTNRDSTYNQPVSYVGDNLCFANVDSTTTAPINTDTAFLDYQSANESEASTLDLQTLSNESLISIDNNIDQVNQNIGYGNETLGDISGTLMDIETSLNNQTSDSNTVNVDFPTWSATGTQSEFLDNSIALIAAHTAYDTSIENAKIQIQSLFTPSFGAASSHLCDGGVNVQGLTLSICWTDHINLLAQLGIVIMFIASFVSIRILLVG